MAKNDVKIQFEVYLFVRIIQCFNYSKFLFLTIPINIECIKIFFFYEKNVKTILIEY